jgi:hypothetical protein
MTLRALISFDHVQLTAAFALTVGTTYATPNSLQTQYGAPGAMMTGNSSNGANISTTPSPGWLSLGVSNSTLYAGYVISLADSGLFQGGATQAWLGFRTYATGLAPSGCNCFGVLPSSAAGVLGGGGANIVSLINETQLNRVTAGVAGAQYVEVFLDNANHTYQTYVNGVATTSGTLPTGFTHFVYSGQTFSGSFGQAFRDFYFLDVDATKPNGRLGPITSTPLSPLVSGVQAPNYGNFIGTLNGASAISNAQAKFGPASFTTNGVAAGAVVIPDAVQYRTVTGDMTYECWAMCANTGQSAGFLCKDSGASPWARLQYVSGAWQLLTDQSSGTPALSVTGNPVVNQWFHLALVRYQGTWTIYQNGVALGNVAGNATFGNNTSNLILGNNNNLTSPWQGYIDEFRVSNVARYTTGFTPPTGPFTTDANTMLLMHLDASVLNGSTYVADSSGNTVSALQTAYAATAAITPFVQNGADNQPMTVNFAPSVPAGQKVLAMQYKLAAQVPFAINLLASLQEGATNKALATYQFRDTAAQYTRDLAGIQTTDPNGNAWTSSTISATNLVLQPQSTTAANIN